MRINGTPVVRMKNRGHYDGTNCNEFTCPACDRSTLANTHTLYCECNDWFLTAPKLFSGGYTFLPH